MDSSALAPLEVTGRLDRLRTVLAGPSGSLGGTTEPVDALIVTELANVRWLTGFTGSAGIVLVTPQRAVLVTDGRYRTQAAQQVARAGVADAVQVVIGSGTEQRAALVAGVDGAGRVGLEADHISWSAQSAWSEHLAGSSIVPVIGAVEQLRQIKDDAEIVRMELAAAVADGALADVVPLLAEAGRGQGSLTESELAAALDHAMRRRGAEDRAFETIVASGENAAKPHARPSGRRLSPGDPVVIDFGAMVDGYRSDMTRTFCLGGEPTGVLADVFAVVAESQRRGVDTVAPGVATGDVDAACRAVIDAAGWADRFEHGTGHGVGLDIHEGPAVGAGSTAILAPGTVVTVEPGVYLPGVGGVRIEDTVVVTNSGCRPLTRFPKEVAV